jgi:hypothetical protein
MARPAATVSSVQIYDCVVTCSAHAYWLIMNARVTSVCLMNEIIIHSTIVNVAIMHLRLNLYHSPSWLFNDIVCIKSMASADRAINERGAVSEMTFAVLQHVQNI